MALRPIIKWGHPTLHAPSVPVEELAGGIKTLIDDMVETM